MTYFDREQLTSGKAVRTAADDPNAVAHVSFGQVARSQWAVIVDADTGEELPDGRVGEIWLHGDNVCRGYWGRPDETRRAFGAWLRSRLPAASHADGAPVAASGCAPGTWVCTWTASSTSRAESRTS